ncbi:MAG: aspartate aminotransferase family protein [Pseudomonadota bacterium]
MARLDGGFFISFSARLHNAKEGLSYMGKEQHTFDVYSPPAVEFTHGEGSRLFDRKGNEYIDCTSGIAVNSLGHSHPHLVKAMKEAADGIWHLSNLFTIPGQKKLATRLCEATFADRVFFTNSGAEAMECAIKTARRYHYAQGNPERINIITFEGAFHGRTIATIAAGGQEKYLEGFGPKTPGFISLPFFDHEALEAAIDDTTAAILVEPIQGEGGVREVPGQGLKELRELCDQNGLLLMFDEVQSGVGRTGKFFAHQWYDVEPDIMAVAKGIGGGFPLGACLAREEVAIAMELGTHGSTYGGNPLAMAMGNAVLDVVLEDGFMQGVQDKSIAFRQLLAELVDTYPDLLEDVRGKGLLMGMKAKVTNIEIVNAMRDAGVLVVGAGNNVVRIVPPLVISDEEMRAARDRMITALDVVQASTTA